MIFNNEKPTNKAMRDYPDFILLNIGYAEPNKRWNWQEVYSPFARMYYVKEGHAKVILHEKTYDLHPNRLYLIPPFTLHSNACEGIFSHYYIHFYEKATNRESIFDKYSFPVEIEADELQLELIKKLLRINPERYLKEIDPQLYDNLSTISKYIDDNTKLPLSSQIETQGILYQLIASFFIHVSVKAVNKDERVVKCLQYIHENINRIITLDQLAAIAYVTEDHLIRIFKKDTNSTPLQYVNLKKIEQAQLLLVSTNKSIRDIAFEISVDNISYFNRLFKQHTSLTPSDYRVKYREG